MWLEPERCVYVHVCRLVRATVAPECARVRAGVHPRSPRVRVLGFVSTLSGGRGGGGGPGATVPGSRAPGSVVGGGGVDAPAGQAETPCWQVGGHTPGAGGSWSDSGALTWSQLEGKACLAWILGVPCVTWGGGACMGVEVWLLWVWG